MQIIVIKTLLIFLLLLELGCQHLSPSLDALSLPAWIRRPAEVKWDAKATAAAQLACRNEKPTLSAKEKISLQLYEAHYRILLFSPQKDDSNQIPQWNKILQQEAKSLRATHVGAFDGPVKKQRCVAVVLLRRLVNNNTYLPHYINLKSVTPITLQLQHPISRPQLFVQHPDGHIHQEQLKIKDGRLEISLAGAQWAKGHYIVEILGQTTQNNPEILFWWRLTQKERAPHPWPRLRFEELSQTDLARGMKIENMIVQLRGTAQVHRLHVSPQLKKTAEIRARALSQIQGVGHTRPYGQTPDQTLKAHFHQPEVTRIAEIQAQSATLKEAWDGIVESPAHVIPLISKGVSHMGAAAIISEDAAEQPLVTMVILLGSHENMQLDSSAQRLRMLSQWNEWRHENQLPLFTLDSDLEKEAQRAAQLMAQEGPVETWTVEKNIIPTLLNKYNDMEKLTGSLLYGEPPTVVDKIPWVKEKNWSVVGIGLLPSEQKDAWFVCILVGQKAE